ncbi:hypothetical protein D3C72_2437530 [compost metagenome]
MQTEHQSRAFNSTRLITQLRADYTNFWTLRLAHHLIQPIGFENQAPSVEHQQIIASRLLTGLIEQQRSERCGNLDNSQQ